MRFLSFCIFGIFFIYHPSFSIVYQGVPEIDRQIEHSIKKERNLLDLLDLLMVYEALIDSDFNESYDLIGNNRAFVECNFQNDTTATVLIKNLLNHTIHKIEVNFDTIRVKKMQQYSVVKDNYTHGAQNTAWKTEYANSFTFEYDQFHLLTIKKSQNGQESVPHLVNNYRFNYIDNQLQNIEQLHRDTYITSIAYYNGKMKMDSIYRYSINYREKKTEFIEKFLYTNPFENQIHKEIIRPSLKLDLFHAEQQETKIVIVRTFQNPFGNLKKQINRYYYDEGRLTILEQYNLELNNLDDPIEEIIQKINPQRTEYFYNEHNQVIKEITTSSDSCHDTRETTDYTIGESGFISQTNSTRTVKTKCIY